jgi:hypothetical protein
MYSSAYTTSALLWDLQGKQETQAPTEYALCQNALIPTKEVAGKLYYKI